MEFRGTVTEFRRIAGSFKGSMSEDAWWSFLDRVVEISTKGDLNERDKDRLIGAFVREHFAEDLGDYAEISTAVDKKVEVEDDDSEDVRELEPGDVCPQCRKGVVRLIKDRLGVVALQCSSMSCMSEYAYEEGDED